MTTEKLAAEIQVLLDNGWLPCGTCEGKAYANRVPGVEPCLCNDCDDFGFLHPFLSWEEWQEQIEADGAGGDS
jgi:hypothetical protein